jgi:hypothetical protein
MFLTPDMQTRHLPSRSPHNFLDSNPNLPASDAHEPEIQPSKGQELEMQNLYARPDLQPQREVPDVVSESVGPRKINSAVFRQRLSERLAELSATIDAMNNELQYSRARVATFPIRARLVNIHSGQDYQQQCGDSVPGATNIFQESTAEMTSALYDMMPVSIEGLTTPGNGFHTAFRHLSPTHEIDAPTWWITT